MADPPETHSGVDVAQPFIFIIHMAAAFAYLGAGALPMPGDAALLGQWHLLPADLLRNDLARSLYDLHAQPPLYNAWAAAFIKAFWPSQFVAMTCAQILLGALIAVMSYTLLRDWTHRPRFAFAAGVLLALNPALIIYEPHGYEILTAFGLTLTVYLFHRHDRSPRAALLAAAVGVMALTTLTRSAYHPALLAPVAGLACAIAGRRWRRLLACSVLIALVPLAWCGKNQARFGFFGTSSWAGQNLWKIASLNHDNGNLLALAEDGVIEPRVLEAGVFRLPRDYAHLGFDRKTGRPALDRDNRNNINIVAVSRMYGRNALRLIRHDPGRYALNALKAYRLFCLPSSEAIPQSGNGAFRAHERLYAAVQGNSVRWVIQRIAGRDTLFSFWLAALPATFFLYAWAARKRRLPAAVHVAALIVAYTAAVSTFAEYGENNRFKFAIEPVLWPLLLAGLVQFGLEPPSFALYNHSRH